ncbi:MAG: class A beta-lactamase-related serine hydrolase [Bacillota bacterium]|nr:class A beta-lactamase-related serine hydrolase [Bacillota bacterium]
MSEGQAAAGLGGRLAARLEPLLERAAGRVALAVEGLHRGRVYAREAERPFYPASVIKLAVMVEAFAQAAEGRVDLEEELVVRASDTVTGSGVLQYLLPGRRYPLIDLVTLMMIVSDNTATNVLVDRLGAEAITARMRALGLPGIAVRQKLQVVPVPPGARNEMTAGETARLLRLIGLGQVVSYDACRRMVAILEGQQLDLDLAARLPDPDPAEVGQAPRWRWAHKTGWVTGRLHDAGLLYLPNGVWAIAAFTEGFPHPEEARATLAALGEALYEELLAAGDPPPEGGQGG